ncbi:PREDICTED: L-xylulose reductase-like [Priapulus caudatus]|uniref:L-xylulose reductase-like n=1 Tax=Priapulus caudatus TaxID=37621 RepID=A0ABM1E8D7_PRICU|nr:PREDICTED: L-xylulose reductase-like [Priapulus caudatus]
MSPQKRLDAVREKRLCFNCLQFRNHTAKMCKFPARCGVNNCTGKHSKLLHAALSAARDKVSYSQSSDTVERRQDREEAQVKQVKGIGRGLCKALADCGAHVIALSKSVENLHSLKQEIPGIEIVVADLGDRAQTRKAIEGILPIHLLVNNAGISKLAPFLEVLPEDFDSVIDINLRAVFDVSQVVARDMVARKMGGAIVNVSSMASQRALLNHTAYCSSKAGLDMLTKMMALELGPHKIRVNSVNPIVVLTEMGKMAWSDPAKAGPMLSRIPLQQFAEVEHVIQPILYLLSDKAQMVNGTTLGIEGGFWSC